AGCPQHHRVHRLVEFDDAPGLPHLLTHGAVERVELFGPIQRDGGDVGGSVDVEQDSLETHWHFQSGFRFSAKAFGPSRASSVRSTRSRNASASISASCSGRSRPLRMASLVPRTASGALELTTPAIS